MSNIIDEIRNLLNIRISSREKDWNKKYDDKIAGLNKKFNELKHQEAWTLYKHLLGGYEINLSERFLKIESIKVRANLLRILFAKLENIDANIIYNGLLNKYTENTIPKGVTFKDNNSDYDPRKISDETKIRYNADISSINGQGHIDDRRRLSVGIPSIFFDQLWLHFRARQNLKKFLPDSKLRNSVINVLVDEKQRAYMLRVIREQKETLKKSLFALIHEDNHIKNTEHSFYYITRHPMYFDNFNSWKAIYPNNRDELYYEHFKYREKNVKAVKIEYRDGRTEEIDYAKIPKIGYKLEGVDKNHTPDVFFNVDPKKYRDWKGYEQPPVHRIPVGFDIRSEKDRIAPGIDHFWVKKNGTIFPRNKNNGIVLTSNSAPNLIWYKTTLKGYMDENEFQMDILHAGPQYANIISSGAGNLNPGGGGSVSTSRPASTIGTRGTSRPPTGRVTSNQTQDARGTSTTGPSLGPYRTPSPPPPKPKRKVFKIPGKKRREIEKELEREVERNLPERTLPDPVPIVRPKTPEPPAPKPNFPNPKPDKKKE